MPIRLDAIVSAIAAEAGLDPDRVTQDDTNIIRWVNDVRRELHELPVRHRSLEHFGELVGVANVTAGTCKATQNQAEITGSSTSWATAMAGRYMKIGSQPWQRVSFISDSTHLTLESGWNSGTVTGQSYTIWKRDYEMPPNVNRVVRFVDYSNSNRELAFEDNAEFHMKHGFGDSFSDPEAFTEFGLSELGPAYLGSTVFTSVSITSNSPIIDFSGTGLVTAMARGDRLRIGDTTTSTAFYVDRVLTDTKVALTRYIGQTGSSLSATALSMNRRIVRFFPAIDGSKVYFYEAYRMPFDLIGDGDWLEEGWYTAIKKGAVARAMGYVGSPREELKIREYEAAKLDLIRSEHRIMNPSSRLKPHIPGRYGGANLFGSKRDEP